MKPDAMPRDERVWDLPVRICHWLLVLLVPAAWASAEFGDVAKTQHEIVGLTLLGVVLFRLVWGLVGSRTARFASFVRGPKAILAYARGLFSKEAEPVVGHNPLGALSVLALLAALLAQAGTGLFTDDDVLAQGPLRHLVSYDTARALTSIHHTIFDGLLALITLHLLAVLFYALVRRQNLVGPMITGRRRRRK